MYIRFSIRNSKAGKTLVTQVFESERVSSKVKKKLICHLGSLSLKHIDEKFLFNSYLKSCQNILESKVADPIVSAHLKAILPEKLGKYLKGYQKKDINIKEGF